MKKVKLLCVTLMTLLALAACGNETGRETGSKSEDENKKASFADLDNFENVTWSYEVVFDDQTDVNKMVLKFTEDTLASVEASGHEEICPEEYEDFYRESYIGVIAKMAEAFSNQNYSTNGNVLSYNDEFSCNVEFGIIADETRIEASATIKMSNVVVKLNADGLIEEIECDVIQEYAMNGEEGTLAFHAVFTFEDYGTTVIN